MGNSFEIIFYISFSIFLVGFLFQTLRILKFEKDKYSKEILWFSGLATLFSSLGILGETLFIIISIVFNEEIKIGIIVAYIFLVLNVLSVIVNYIVDNNRLKDNNDISLDKDGVIYVDAVVHDDEVKQERICLTGDNNKV